jgi:hypothetical protein
MALCRNSKKWSAKGWQRLARVKETEQKQPSMFSKPLLYAIILSAPQPQEVFAGSLANRKFNPTISPHSLHLSKACLSSHLSFLYHK